MCTSIESFVISTESSNEDVQLHQCAVCIACCSCDAASSDGSTEPIFRQLEPILLAVNDVFAVLAFLSRSRVHAPAQTSSSQEERQEKEEKEGQKEEEEGLGR